MKYKVGNKVDFKGTDITGTIEKIGSGTCIVQTSTSKVTAFPEDLILIEELAIDITPKFGEYSEDNTPPTEWNLPDGYQFKDENGNVINAAKIVLEKKKPKYPTSYKECLKVLGIEGDRLMFCNSGITQYERELYIKMNNLSKLLICRDAYWEIAGIEMGLCKPWKPDWDSLENKYSIYNYRGNIKHDYFTVRDRCLLVFPTEEMRDAFKESEEIGKLIEDCKELL